MRVGFVADVHVGNHGVFGGPIRRGMNHRCWLVLRTLEVAVCAANERGCAAFVVLGDLFDKSNPNPQMVAEVGSILSQFKGSVHLIVGNHDRVSDTEGDHAFGPLARMGFAVHEQPAIHGELVFIPYQAGKPSDWLYCGLNALKAEHALPADNGVLCSHVGVYDFGETKRPWLATESAMHDVGMFELLEEFNLRAAFVGDYHYRHLWQQDGRAVYQVGTLAPTGFGDIDAGHLAVLDTDTGVVAWEEILGPRFETVTIDSMPSLIGVDSFPNITYRRITTSPEYFDAVCAAVTESGIDARTQVLVDDSVTKAQLKVAATRAQGADSVAQALREYVDSYPLEEPATVNGVMRRLDRYTRQARV